MPSRCSVKYDHREIKVTDNPKQESVKSIINKLDTQLLGRC